MRGGANGTVYPTAVIPLREPDVPVMVIVAGIEVTAADESAESVSTWVPA